MTRKGAKWVCPTVMSYCNDKAQLLCLRDIHEKRNILKINQTEEKETAKQTNKPNTKY
jgi:CobQ-like glutamine amidotransferase family enzyme